MSEWKKYSGEGMPVPDGVHVIAAILVRPGEEPAISDITLAENFDWCWIGEPSGGDIVAYRIVDCAENAYEEQKHSHYYRECPYEHIDVYRVLGIFEVTDPCLQHACKKLLVAGGRGHKSIEKDIQDCIDTLERWKQMRSEESQCSK